MMSEEEAERYHAVQIKTFSETDADLVSAFTISYAEEAIGLARAARSAGMPVVISFTVETDGKLPSGQTLKEAEQLDEGNPVELGRQFRELTAKHDHLNVLGGCCGTDHRHIEEISKSCAVRSNTVSAN